MPSIEIVIAVYVVSSAVELYFFLMQRATLEIARANNFDATIGRHMLPLWYTAVWPTKLVRWGCLLFILQGAGWIAFGGAFGAVMLATSLWPVPFAHFVPMFKRKVSNDMGTEHGQYAPKLTLALLAFPNEVSGK